MNKDSDVYIINYWYGYNYGASLTAFAIYTVLQNLSMNPHLINNMNSVEEYLQNDMFSQKFLEPICSITQNINSYLYIKNINKKNGIFFTGSDQVFRPYLTKNKLGQFLLNFVNEQSKKIAISASFGVDKEQFMKETDSTTIEQMKKSLNSFDYISVREKSGIEICKDIFGIDAELIIDPVFMIDKQYYIDIANKSNKNYSNSIATYIFHKTKDYKNIYDKFAKKYNANIEELAFKNKSMEDWLATIINSKLVITDSFHGICFCLIFNKPFICPAKGMTAHTRFDSLFDMLGIYNQIVYANEILSKNCIFNIDYDHVNQRIQEEKEKGINFLKKSLCTPSQKEQEKKDIRIEYLDTQLYNIFKNKSLKKQLTIWLWNLWLIIWNKYLPKPIQSIVNFLRGKNNA